MQAWQSAEIQDGDSGYSKTWISPNVTLKHSQGPRLLPGVLASFHAPRLGWIGANAGSITASLCMIGIFYEWPTILAGSYRSSISLISSAVSSISQPLMSSSSCSSLVVPTIGAEMNGFEIDHAKAT